MSWLEHRFIRVPLWTSTCRSEVAPVWETTRHEPCDEKGEGDVVDCPGCKKEQLVFERFESIAEPIGHSVARRPKAGQLENPTEERGGDHKAGAV